MSSSSLFYISITLLVLILPVASVYNVYSYDDGHGGEEHCCVARIRENLCLATPITRSLVQVNKQCHRFDGPNKRHRYGEKRNKNEYLEKISRRLDIQSSEEIGDKILLELKKPLDTHMVQKDLVCLASKTHDINFEKCHMELVDDSDDDMDDDNDSDEDDHKPHKRHRHRGSHRHNHHRFDRQKRASINNNTKESDIMEDDDVETKQNKAEKETHRMELHQPVQIREGRGFTIRQTYTLNVTEISKTNRVSQKCLSWYRKKTRKVRHNSSKQSKSCTKLTDHVETCINQLVYSDTETNNHPQHTIVSFAKGSKLYCQDRSGHAKLLGSVRFGNVCFRTNEQILIEQSFTDIVGLSHMNKNEDVLKFITDNKKFAAEFKHDCHDKSTLVEFVAQDKEFQHKTHTKQIKKE
ncbi:unnamed protein product [Adineta steineri]|uniref:Uncharacterized protein n=1 Tax=Adineta steineri TaxID=433720 RepID=A0A814MCP4_9BILA|nr:unnamed protein product [Adineta steineri]